ncbi:MAG: hypothetical protein ACETWG_01025 [Candidatus Neomarinimicrobiota bacterium]
MKRSACMRGAILLLALIRLAEAQSSLELVGFGLWQSPADVVSQGIGDITTVPYGPQGWLYAAPSTWHYIRATQLHASLKASRSQLGDLGPYDRVEPQNLQFLIHVNRRTGYSIGIQPVSRVDISIKDTSGVFDLSPDTLRYTQSRSSVGGLSAFRIGVSRRIGSAVSLGVVLNVLFGTLTQRDTLEFLSNGQREDLLSGMIAERRLEFNGQMLDLSLLAVFPPESEGQVGIRIVLPLYLKLTDIRTYLNQPSPDPLRYDGVGIPTSCAVGYGVNFARKHRILAEIGLSQLRQTQKNDLAFGRYLKATRSLRLGWARTPSGEELFNLGRLYYRVGFYWMDYYLHGLNNSPLAEVAFTAGLGYQTPRFGHWVDVSFQMGRRESLLPGIQFEKFYRVSVGVTTAELWFIRPKKKWD